MGLQHTRPLRPEPKLDAERRSCQLMNAPDSLFLPDVQASADLRQLAIQQAGVRAIRHPVTIASARGPQPAVASIDMFVGLPAHHKATHMSRVIAVLQEPREPPSTPQ